MSSSEDDDDNTVVTVANETVLKCLAEKLELMQKAPTINNDDQIIIPYPTNRYNRLNKYHNRRKGNFAQLQTTDILFRFDFINISMTTNLSLETQYLIWGEPSTYQQGHIRCNIKNNLTDNVLPKKFAVLAGRYIRVQLNSKKNSRCYFEITVLVLNNSGNLLDYATASGIAEQFSDISGMLQQHEIQLLMYFANINDDLDLFLKYEHSPIYRALTRVKQVQRLHGYGAGDDSNLLNFISICPFKSGLCSFCTALKHAHKIFNDRVFENYLSSSIDQNSDKPHQIEIVNLPKTIGKSKNMQSYEQFTRSLMKLNKRNHSRTCKDNNNKTKKRENRMYKLTLVRRKI